MSDLGQHWGEAIENESCSYNVHPFRTVALETDAGKICSPWEVENTAECAASCPSHVCGASFPPAFFFLN